MMRMPCAYLTILPSDLMVEVVHNGRIRRRFRDGARRGKNKARTKVYRVPPTTRPSQNLLVDSRRGVAYCHPSIYPQVVALIEAAIPQVSPWSWSEPSYQGYNPTNHLIDALLQEESDE